jgi:hypothetical protein
MDPVWTAVVAFAGGSLMSTLVAAFATHLIFHPVISVCLNSKKGCHGPTTLLGRDAAGNEVRSEVKYFRLYIENTGLSSIKSCSGYITELRKRVGGQEIRAPRDIIELGWAHKSDAPRDIPRGAFFYIDVATLYGTVLSLSHKFPTTLLLRRQGPVRIRDTHRRRERATGPQHPGQVRLRPQPRRASVH